MEKVKLNKEQANAIEVQLEYSSPSAIVATFAREGSRFIGSSEPINGMSLDDIIRALYIGYEVEQTPEEKAIQWMIEKDCLRNAFSEHDIVMAIKRILNAPCQ